MWGRPLPGKTQGIPRSLRRSASLLHLSSRRSPLFDAYIAVDWSAAASPKTGEDSIWLGATTRVAGRPRRLPEVNPATRAEALATIRERLVVARRAGLRVAVGFDLSLAYPRGFASRLGCEGPLAWRQGPSAARPFSASRTWRR